jgi:osmotically inducible protein OsmC
VTDSISTTVDIELGFADNGNPEIKSLHFTVHARVPGASEAQLQDFAEKARVGCTISKIIKLETTVSATLLA